MLASVCDNVSIVYIVNVSKNKTFTEKLLESCKRGKKKLGRVVTLIFNQKMSLYVRCTNTQQDKGSPLLLCKSNPDLKITRITI